MHIDWSITQVYNTIVSVATGIALLMLVRFSQHVTRIMGLCWRVTGILFVLFGAMNYFTHIGLIINTM